MLDKTRNVPTDFSHERTITASLSVIVYFDYSLPTSLPRCVGKKLEEDKEEKEEEQEKKG